MNSRDMSLEQSQEWQDSAEEDYINRIDIDKEINQANRQGNKSEARSKVEALKERRQLDELLYDVFKDSDSIM